MGKYLLLFLFFMIFCFSEGYSQISESGFPRMPVKVKLAASHFIDMPPLNNDMLRWADEQEKMMLLQKAFRFAHGFDVYFSPQTYGQWMVSEDGWQIWQLHIRSENAYSLNLIFEEFKPGKEDRLFLFTPDYKSVLGAFTSANITESRVFPVSPLPGDEIIVQYETRQQSKMEPFVITQVNHDYKDILKYFDTRRPLGKTAGECIPDINCEVAETWREVQNSVARVMVRGTELCTGTLMNNTAENSRPYLLTANHCITTASEANSSLFLFNYESPYCGSLDGHVTNSISGSTLRAAFDSLDFSLVELSLPPPPSFRPYYAGWTIATVVTDTSACIQHSQGDIKKISIDNHRPQISDFAMDGYKKSGFWRILQWDYGSTEEGASGAALFNSAGLVAGNLVGGSSSCTSPRNDYFTRFNLAWDYKSQPSQQLKYWLDPQNTNLLQFDGKQYYEGREFCGAFTNMKEGDDHELLELLNSNNEFAGYWAGTNSLGINEVGEKFKIPGNEALYGVSIGIGERYIKNVNTASNLRLNIYNLKGSSTEVIYTQTVSLRDMFSDAMNFIKFSEEIAPSDSFLVAINFESIVAGDTVALYQAIRDDSPQNSMYIKQNGKWSEFKSSNNSDFSGALTFELIACNVEGKKPELPDPDAKLEITLSPNPTSRNVEVAAKSDITEDMIAVYNIIGQQVPFSSQRLTPRKIALDLSGNSTGVYVIRVTGKNNRVSGKIMLNNN